MQQSVSTSERSIYHTQAGFDPPFAEGAEFAEWKTDAFTNQDTMAGLNKIVKFEKIWKNLKKLFNVNIKQKNKIEIIKLAGGWMEVRAVLRIANSNQHLNGDQNI